MKIESKRHTGDGNMMLARSYRAGKDKGRRYGDREGDTKAIETKNAEANMSEASMSERTM